MRYIIIIQSLIILGAAVYIYHFNQKNKPESTEVYAPESTARPTAPDRIEGYVPPSSNPPPYFDVSASSTIQGANDAGMEYPIPD